MQQASNKPANDKQEEMTDEGVLVKDDKEVYKDDITGRDKENVEILMNKYIHMAVAELEFKDSGDVIDVGTVEYKKEMSAETIEDTELEIVNDDVEELEFVEGFETTVKPDENEDVNETECFETTVK